MQPTCYVMCGIPASGKSTMREKMNDMNTDAFVYSTDSYVDEIAKQRGVTYSDLWADMIGDATKQMDEWLGVAIQDGRDVIWDQTNIGVGKRKKIINRMKQAGYRVEAHAVRLPEPGHIDAWKELAFRLKNRPGKSIPENVMKNMTDNYVLPETDEGFDEVMLYNMYGVVVG
jgi:predicted ABC-type ATPase